MGLPNQTQHLLPCNREVPHSWNGYQRTNSFPWEQDHAFNYVVIWPGFLKNVSNQTSFPHMGWWELITSSVSKYHSNLYTITSSEVGEWSHWCSEDTNLSDGDLLVTLNLKGILGEVPVQEGTSSPEIISSIGSCTTSPSSPSCNSGKGKAPFCALVPLLLAVLHFPMLWQKYILCTVSQYPICWIPSVHNRYKGLEILFSVRIES